MFYSSDEKLEGLSLRVKEEFEVLNHDDPLGGNLQF
jgi:hypothetical protein